jgi:hypothetical protein
LHGCCADVLIATVGIVGYYICRDEMEHYDRSNSCVDGHFGWSLYFWIDNQTMLRTVKIVCGFIHARMVPSVPISSIAAGRHLTFRQIHS